MLKNSQYENIDDVRVAIMEIITNIPRHDNEMLRSCELEVDVHIKKAIENINFWFILSDICVFIIRDTPQLPQQAIEG